MLDCRLLMQAALISVHMVSLCCASFLPPTPSTSTPSPVATPATQYHTTTIEVNVTCTGTECHTHNQLDITGTLWLRICIIAAAIVTFVGLVKMSEVINRRCKCHKKQNVHFTRI